MSTIRVLRLRAFGYRLAKDYPTSIAAHLESVRLWRALSPKSSHTANGLSALAETERLAGEFDNSELHFREALRIAKVIEDRGSEANITGHLAHLALDRADWPGAESLARESLSLGEMEPRQELIAENCSHLAKALVRQGKAAEALTHARRAVDIYPHLRSPDLEAARETLRECEAALGEGAK